MSLYIDTKFMVVSDCQNMPVSYALDLATDIQQFYENPTKIQNRILYDH